MPDTVMLKLPLRDAELLMKHMRWEDVREETEGDHRLRAIYEKIKTESERARDRIRTIKRSLFAGAGLIILAHICVELLVFQ